MVMLFAKTSTDDIDALGALLVKPPKILDYEKSPMHEVELSSVLLVPFIAFAK